MTDLNDTFYSIPSTISSWAVPGGCALETYATSVRFFFSISYIFGKKDGFDPLWSWHPMCEILDPNADTTSFDTALLSISNVLLWRPIRPEEIATPIKPLIYH